MTEILANMALGFDVAFSPLHLWYCFLGVFLGTVVGVLPGIGALATISLLLPITYHLSTLAAIIMLAGVYYGAVFGSSTASILLKLPGTPASAVVCEDGYAMTKKGRGGVALFMTAIASYVGGTIGIILLTVFSPIIVKVAIQFGPAEYFALMVLGLVAASTLSSGSAAKGLAMVVFGILLGLVGTDVNSGIFRFTFDFFVLLEGINLIVVVVGLFGVAEVIATIIPSQSQKAQSTKVTWRKLLPTKDDWSRSWFPMLRGSGIGSFCGTLPGVGCTVASFMAYALEVRVSHNPARFGKGAIEGVTAPESANNSAVQTAFIPTLTLGIPGDAVMAVMIGALMIHGIAPGPLLMVEEPDLFWGLIASFWIGNLMLIVLNVPFVGLWVRLLKVPYNKLYPAIVLFVCIGIFSINNNVYDIVLVLIFGVIGYFMSFFSLPPAPFLLGFILGPLMEEYFRRAMLISRGSPLTFLERPISASFILFSFALILISVLCWLRSWLRVRRQYKTEQRRE